MKSLIIFAVILSSALSKPVDTEAEKIECFTNYLKSKQLLDASINSPTRTGQLECDTFIKKERDTILRTGVDETTNAAFAGEDIKNDLQRSKKCFSETFSTLKYPELKMKLFIYTKSSAINAQEKKKLTKAVRKSLEKNVEITSMNCLADNLFGDMFDGLIEKDDREVVKLESKKNDYCIRKYVVDNRIVDTSKFNIVLNPYNIQLNFDCTKYIGKEIKSMEGLLLHPFDIEGNSSSQQKTCMERVVATQKPAHYLAKVIIMSEVNITNDQKKALRVEFINNIKTLSGDMIKCL